MEKMKKLCPIRYPLDIIGGKWKLPILCTLSADKPTRYGMLKRKLANITNMMLAQSLKELEAQGLIHRKQYNEVPPKVEYTLTADAIKLIELLKMLAGWGVEQINNSRLGELYCAECSGKSVPVEKSTKDFLPETDSGNKQA